MSRSKPEGSEQLGFSATMRAGVQRLPKRIDFYRMPRPVQDRFAATTHRTAPPAPLLYAPAPAKRVWGYLAASGALASAATALLLMGWGNIDSPMALHGVKLLAVDVALFAASAYGVVHAMGVLRALDALPWRAGIYLFPASVIDARDRTLLVWPMSEADSISRVSSPEPGLALRMRDGGTVVVPGRSDALERAESALGAIRPELARAVAEEDSHALAELDPLHDRAMSSPVGPTESMRPRIPVSKRFDWAIALAIGAAIGLAMGTTRNGMSDDAMYQGVLATGSIDAYRQYLAQGGRHADEVRDVLLPRAELRQAEAAGTVEAVQAFASAHPSSKIESEIDVALRRAMLVELERARRAGTVRALDEFAKKYPDSKVDAELKGARHALYGAALASWRKSAHPDAPTEAFMGRLLGWAEKNPGGAIDIRFRLKPMQTIDDADKSVMRSGRFAGPDALPSKYITDDAMHQREERVAQSLAAGVAAAFPADVLTARVAPPLAADAPTPSGSPAILVEYSPEWSRGNTTSAKPPTVFAGLIFSFDTSFVAAEGPPLKFNVKAWRGAELWKVKGDSLTFEEFQQRVYDAMIDGAFDQLGKRLSDTLL